MLFSLGVSICFNTRGTSTYNKCYTDRGDTFTLSVQSKNENIIEGLHRTCIYIISKTGYYLRSALFPPYLTKVTPPQYSNFLEYSIIHCKASLAC